MKKYMDTIIPISCDLEKAFPGNVGDGNLKGRELLLSKKIGEVECGGITSAVEIPMSFLEENGFTVRAYLKNVDIENPASVDKKSSGIIVVSIQHKEQEKSFMQDAVNLKLDTRSELEVSTLITTLVDYEKSGALGAFDLQKFYEVTKENLKKIAEQEAYTREQRNKTIEMYAKDPEKAKKETKKVLDNIRFKQQQMKEKKDKTTNDIKKFQDDLLVLVNKLCVVNGGVNSIEDIKKIPEVAAEIEKGSDIAKVLDVLSAMVNFGQMDKKEETEAVKALETDEDRMLREAREEAAKNNVEL